MRRGTRARRWLRERGSRADLAAIRAALDRNYHWLVHADRRQHELAATLDSVAGELRGAVGRVDGAVGHLGREFGREVDGLRHTLAAVAEQVAWNGAPVPPPDGPLVSVVCPVYNRAPAVDRVLASLRAQTYSRWECLLVDDGSDDVDDGVVRRWQSDARVRVIRLPDRRGAAAARNQGLGAAAGEIIAYLDSDNTCHPTYLARLVDAFMADPDVRWTLASQLVVGNGMLGIRPDRFSVDTLTHGNFIDLNAVAHRRSLLTEISGPAGFDESFARLSDWELIQRFARTVGEPARISAVGSIYHQDHSDRVSTQVPLHPHLGRLRARGRGRPAEGLRVLVAVAKGQNGDGLDAWSDVVGLDSLGGHVEAWAAEDLTVHDELPVPVHRGELAATVAATQPDVVLTHGLEVSDALHETVRRAGVPFAVRLLGLDDDPMALDRLLAEPDIVVHALSAVAAAYGKPHPRLRTLPIAFDQDRFPPTADKDRRLVVGTGVVPPTDDGDRFVEVARRCPDHRFVLVLHHGGNGGDQLDEIVARRDGLAAPVEILVDTPPDKAAELVCQAGIYLHSPDGSRAGGLGSIAQALGTGCYVLTRDVPGMSGFVADAAGLYRDAEHAAALIQQTVHWNDARWAQVWHKATDHAHAYLGAADVASTMVEQWAEVLGIGPSQRPAG